jgi:hypothetical protein
MFRIDGIYKNDLMFIGVYSLYTVYEQTLANSVAVAQLPNTVLYLYIINCKIVVVVVVVGVVVVVVACRTMFRYDKSYPL